jgi:hypothetical protein
MAAPLSNPERSEVGARFQSQSSSLGETFGVMTKTDIQAAVAAVDDWVVANQVSFNNALPQPARGQLTTSQKARMLSDVVDKRYSTGSYQ